MTQVETQTMKALVEATLCEFQVQLKEVEAWAERGECQRSGTNVDMVSHVKFDGSTSWAVFRYQFKAVAHHNCWTPREKATCLISALQGQDSDMLYGVPKEATYEETLDALED